jgi:hypothetical protein
MMKIVNIIRSRMNPRIMKYVFLFTLVFFIVSNLYFGCTIDTSWFHQIMRESFEQNKNTKIDSEKLIEQINNKINSFQDKVVTMDKMTQDIKNMQ